MSDEFWEAYQEPRWQKKRLQIMERDGFKCRNCGTDKATLNVHHGYYERGAKPWEYADHYLRTLCKTCHKLVEEKIVLIRMALSQLSIEQAERVNGYAHAVMMEGYDEIKILVPSMEFADGIGDFLKADGETIFFRSFDSPENKLTMPQMEACKADYEKGLTSLLS